MCAQMYDREGREYQREWAQGVPLLVRRGLSVVQDKKVSFFFVQCKEKKRTRRWERGEEWRCMM